MEVEGRSFYNYCLSSKSPLDKAVTMGKKVVLGVQKKRRPSKRNHKKKLLNEVIDYLKSDSYLFAPLISSSFSAFNLPHKSGISSSRAVKLKEAAKGNNDTFLKRVEEYLKSDTYMYASLVGPPDQSEGPMKYCKSVTREVSMRASTLEDHKLTVETVQGKNSKDHSAQKVLSDRQTLMHKETVKPMVYQNCRSSFASGEGMLSSQLRKLC